jgi:transposase InsO family protein
MTVASVSPPPAVKLARAAGTRGGGASQLRQERRPSVAPAAQGGPNAVADSFFASLKNELIYRGVWSIRAEARRAVFEYIEVFFNRQRRHSALNYLSPAAHEATRQAARKEAA